METKKNPNVRLERFSSIFFEIGLIIALLISYLILEIKSSPLSNYDTSTNSSSIFIDEVVIPNTERQNKLTAPKPPPSPVNQIMVVANDTQLEHELEIETTEIDENYKVDPAQFQTKEIIAEEEEEDEVYNFQVVETQAVYPGCEKYKTKQQKYLCFQKNIMKHVKKNFCYPEIAKEMGIQGRVIVQFVIGKDGQISKVSILRGIDKNLDNEAMRIVKELPKMQPAKQRGKAVPVSFMLPITFKLQ